MAPEEKALRPGQFLMEDLLDLEIGSLGNRVGGISRGTPEGTVFVRGALPGERVLCRITARKRNRVEAELVDILSPSPSRTEPFCRLFGECGGCSLQHLEYGEQLRWKRNWVVKALERSRMDFPEPGEVIPSPEVRAYRNRVSFDITDGGPGLHRFRGNVMPVDSCPLLNRRGSGVLSAFANADLSPWRRLTVRASERTGGSMTEFRGGHRGIRPPDCGESSVTAWEDNGEWKSAPPGSILTERLAGLEFPVFPGSFFQVNTGAAELLVERVVGECPPSGKIMDLYGGTGTFALPLAGRGLRVTSVEMNEGASLSGRRAVEMNGIPPVEFVTSGVRSFLSEQISAGTSWDSIIVDPPRAGLGIRIARLLRRLRTGVIVMVSCDPFSMAADLREFVDGGWKVRRIQPLDMFPQTDHVETVTTLTRI